MGYFIQDKILSTLFRDEMKKYDERKYDVIYAHHLDNNIIVALQPSSDREINGYMIVGEMIHVGMQKVMRNGEEKCKKIYITDTDNIHPEAFMRFVKYDEYGSHVIICGSPDGIYNNMPVELKTTRNNKLLSKPKKEWVRRIKLYGWLYGSKGLLIVYDIVNGEEANYIFEPFSDEEVKTMIEAWLRGEFPTQSLAFFGDQYKKSISHYEPNP